MNEFIVSFISPTHTIREVLIEAEGITQAKMKALSTATPWLVAEYFAGKVHAHVRTAASPTA